MTVDTGCPHACALYATLLIGITFNGLPKLKVIEREAFSGTQTAVRLFGDFPKLEQIKMYAFNNTRELNIRADCPLLKKIEDRSFAGIGVKSYVMLKDLYRLVAEKNQVWFDEGFVKYRFEHDDCQKILSNNFNVTTVCSALPTSTSTTMSTSTSTSTSKVTTLLLLPTTKISSDDADKSDTMFTTPIVVTIVVAGVALIVIIACFWVALRRKRTSAGFDFPAVQYPNNYQLDTRPKLDTGNAMSAFVNQPLPKRPSALSAHSYVEPVQTRGAVQSCGPAPPSRGTVYDDNNDNADAVSYEDPDAMNDASTASSMVTRRITITRKPIETPSIDVGYEDPDEMMRPRAATNDSSMGYETADAIQGGTYESPEYANANELMSNRIHGSGSLPGFKGFSESPVMQLKHRHGDRPTAAQEYAPAAYLEPATRSASGTILSPAGVYDNDAVVTSTDNEANIFSPCEYDVGNQDISGDNYASAADLAMDDNYASAADLASDARQDVSATAMQAVPMDTSALETQFSPTDLSNQSIDFFLDKFNADPSQDDPAVPQQSATALPALEETHFSETELQNQGIDYFLDKMADNTGPYEDVSA